jgi:hypothetical protein
MLGGVPRQNQPSRERPSSLHSREVQRRCAPKRIGRSSIFRFRQQQWGRYSLRQLPRERRHSGGAASVSKKEKPDPRGSGLQFVGAEADNHLPEGNSLTGSTANLGGQSTTVSAGSMPKQFAQTTQRVACQPCGCDSRSRSLRWLFTSISFSPFRPPLWLAARRASEQSWRAWRFAHLCVGRLKRFRALTASLQALL